MVHYSKDIIFLCMLVQMWMHFGRLISADGFGIKHERCNENQMY